MVLWKSWLELCMGEARNRIQSRTSRLGMSKDRGAERGSSIANSACIYPPNWQSSVYAWRSLKLLHRWVTPSSQKAIGRTIKEINNMGSVLMWDSASPIWYRPQLAPDDDVTRLFRGGKYLQVVGHTPVKDVIRVGGVLSCDTFSTYRDGTPYGSQNFCIVDTKTWSFEKVPTDKKGTTNTQNEA